MAAGALVTLYKLFLLLLLLLLHKLQHVGLPLYSLKVITDIHRLANPTEPEPDIINFNMKQ